MATIAISEDGSTVTITMTRPEAEDLNTDLLWAHGDDEDPGIKFSEALAEALHPSSA
jgi:hypothetical protein